MNCPQCGEQLRCTHLDMAGWSTYLCGHKGCRNQWKLSDGNWYRQRTIWEHFKEAGE